MQMTRKAALQYWATPTVGVVIGLIYLIGFSIGGSPGQGLIGLALMISFSVVLLLAGRRSETIRGLLDHRDERIAGIDLRATAFTALAMIVAILAGFVGAIARGHSGWPYDMIGAVGGLAYIASVIYYRIRR